MNYRRAQNGIETISERNAKQFVLMKTKPVRSLQVTDYYDNHKTVISANHMILLMSIHLILAIADFIPSIDVFTRYNGPRHDHLTPKIYFDSITKLNKNQTKTVILLIFKRQPFEGFVSTVSVMFTFLPSKTKSYDDRYTRSVQRIHFKYMYCCSKSKELID